MLSPPMASLAATEGVLARTRRRARTLHAQRCPAPQDRHIRFPGAEIRPTAGRAGLGGHASTRPAQPSPAQPHTACHPGTTPCEHQHARTHRHSKRPPATVEGSGPPREASTLSTIPGAVVLVRRFDHQWPMTGHERVSAGPVGDLWPPWGVGAGKLPILRMPPLAACLKSTARPRAGLLL